MGGLEGAPDNRMSTSNAVGPHKRETGGQKWEAM